MAIITTTQIPFSSPDLIRPGAGAEQWHNSSARIPNPTESQPIGTENSLDVYYRFEAWRLQDAQGNFTWSYFDGLVQDAINKGQKLSFGIMPFNGDGGGGVSYGGGESAYPQFLHNQMQAESTKDVLSGSEWVPNWNSPSYLKWLRDIHTAIVNRLNTQRYTPTSGPNAGKSVLYGDAINVIDIRGFGNWGEWHIGDIAGDWNSQPNRPTITTLKAIIDAHTQTFDKWPLGMMIAAYDGGASGVPLFHPYPEVAHYALTAKNSWGEVGARRDQVGAPDGYLKNMLEGNNLTYNGSPAFKTLFLEKWKRAPITGEPNPGVAPITGMADLLGQVNLYHHASFGNGNYPFGSSLPLSTRDTIREGFKRAGYRLTIEGGSFTNTNNSISLTLNWKNTGITPTYENWDVAIYLKASNGNIAAQTSSSFKPKLFLPSTTASVVTDTFNFSIPAGTYTLAIKVFDPSGYRSHMPLFITGIQSDGTYNLGTVTIGTTANQPPTVTTTGGSVTLPTSTFSLTANASDSDGTISSYQWTKVSGPTGGTITTPTSRTTTVAALSQGTYVFQVRVTDNQGATATANATIVVNPAVNIPPTVSAGVDKEITLPTNSTLLQGSATDSDGTIVTVWSRTSGSGTIVSPTSLSTNIVNLLQGTSVFRLTVTDNAGAVRFDEVSVKVNPEVVIPVKTIVSITPNISSYTVLYSDGSTEIVD